VNESAITRTKATCMKRITICTKAYHKYTTEGEANDQILQQSALHSQRQSELNKLRNMYVVCVQITYFLNLTEKKKIRKRYANVENWNKTEKRTAIKHNLPKVYVT